MSALPGVGAGGSIDDRHVALRGVGHAYADGLAVEGVDLDVRRGEFVALLGPSGCGKSTLLRLIAGLAHPTAGEVRVAPSRGGVGFVFQDASLLPWRDARENVALPLELAGVAKRERLAAAERALERVELGAAARRFPDELSGGMKMRVSIARALVTDPDLLLLDEPFAALDELTRSRLDLALRELWLARGMTVLFVTHSIGEAVLLADRAIVFSRRPARTLLDHPIDLPRRRPTSLRASTELAAHQAVLLEALERAEAPE